MRRKKKFTSALSFVLSLLMSVSCIQPVMAAQAVPDVESVSEGAAAQAEGNEDTNVSVSAAPAKEETSEAPAEESDSDSGSTADTTETKELKSESSDAAEPPALSDPEISPLADTDAYAILYESGEFVFQRGNTPDAGKGNVLGTYTGFETKAYTSGSKVPWYENRTSVKTVSFKDVVKPVSTAFWFYECKNLTSVVFANLDTSAVTSMRHMFNSCSSLTSLDVSSFDTKTVTSMGYMFWDCSALTSLDLSSFDTSAVKGMWYMFYNCSSLTSLDVSSFDTSAITNMNFMFDNCSSLTSLDLSSFNTSAVTKMDGTFAGCSALTSLDVSSFDTSAVTNMDYMFDNCSSLTSLDLSSFNTSAVTDMSSMFYNCRSLTSLDVSSFDTKAVTSMYSMFNNCSALTSLDLSSFDTSAVTSMYSMFNNCSALTSLDLSSFDISAVTSMKYMFKQCIALGTLTIGTKFAFKGDTGLVDATWRGINTGKGYPTSVLTSTYDGSTMADTYAKYIDIKFDALDGKSSESTKSGYIGMTFDSLPTAEKEGYDFVGWFTEKQGGTQLLVNQPITQSTYYAHYSQNAYAILYESGEMVFQRGNTPDASKGTVVGTYTGFETKKYTTSDRMPWYANRTSIKAVSFKDVIKPVSTVNWFYECKNLTDVDFTNLDTSAVTNMNRMFYKCSALTSLDLSSFNTSVVTDMSSMFNSCSSLTSLDLSSFNTSAVTDMRWMFNRCSSLTSLDLSPFNTSAVTGMYSMFSYCSSLTNLDVSSFDTKSVTNMSYMFKQCTALDTLTLSTKFAFKEDTDLVDATWHGINTGKEYTTSVLTSTYDGSTMADTYIKCFDIKFDAMGGKSSESKKSGYIGMAFDSLPTAEKRGYDFVGWFTEKQGGTQLLVNQPITQSTYYAQYTEHKYTITVTNDVAGTMGDKTKDFTFQLKMTGNTPAELPYTKGTETGKLKVTDGVVEFTLSDGESITLGNILIDTTYKITEVDGASNGYTVESTNSSGTLTEDTNVSFTNTRNGTVPTSAHTNILISIGVFAIALAGLFWHLRKRKQ